VTFERTVDYPLLNGMLRNCGSLYPFLCEDGAPPIEQAAVVEHPNLHYILARDEDLLGFYMFEPRTSVSWEFHTLMPLDGRALAAMRELLGADGWLWTNTNCRRATTYVAASNPLALRFGLRAGLKTFGRDPLSYFKSGELHDRILLGIGKPKD